MRGASRNRFAFRRGVLLLEVLFALTLLAAGAAVILSGLGASAQRTSELRSEVHGADLAVSILSQIQMGWIEPITDGPYPGDPPHQDWTWEVFVEDMPSLSEMDPLMIRVEVIARNLQRDMEYSLVQILPAPEQEDLAAPGEEG
jgi:type II secretory pathway pseudopilin PulG